MVSQEVVLAYMGRVALYEGTYARYVSSDEGRAVALLQIAAEASAKIIGSNSFTLTPVYRDLRLVQSVAGELAYIGNPNEKGFTSSTGYVITKFNNASLGASEILAPNNPTDAPLFWLAEVLLNYAEAQAELGVLTQSDLDATVNLLRTRGGVAPLQLASVPDDPLRDADVSPLLWEIRRERRCELIMDGFREWDIRRWGKLSYLDPSVKPAIFQGAYLGMDNVSLPDGLSLSPDGYILPYGSGTGRDVEIPKNYLDAIPTGELTLYQLRGVPFPQNPGW